MAFVDFVLGMAAVLLLIPICILAVEVLAALSGSRTEASLQGTRPRIAVLVPAHDEASTIEATIRELLPQLCGSDRLIVIADNCADETAAIASAAGADVVVRNDLSRRGKGYALDFGIRYLEPDPPDVVLIVDADCRLADGSIDVLARTCRKSGAPVQALDLMHAPPGSRIMVRIAEFAWLLKNWVRPLGLHHLGLPCQLMGTGMAFPWTRIRSASLAGGHIVEDLKLGLELASDGTPPVFCPEARVTSFFPASREGFRTQRTRWEHGYLSVISRNAPILVMKAMATGNGRLLAMALDLSIPPIALLSLLTAGLWGSTALLYALTGLVLPILLASFAAVLLIASVLAAWARYGRSVVSLGTLVLAVGYALWKIPLYARFLVARQSDWVRSKRDQERSA